MKIVTEGYSDMVDKLDISYKDKLMDNLKEVEDNGIDIHKTRTFYTIQEVSRFKTMYGLNDIKDIKFYNEFLDNLRDECNGYITEASEDITRKWIDIVHELYVAQHRGEDVDHIMRLYGWNPVMAFTHENRSKANKRFEQAIYENVLERFEDISIDFDSITSLSETKTKKNTMWTNFKLNPVYIVLVEGNTPIFSDLTKVVTKGPFSHAALGLDAKLEELYSFNLRAGKNNNKNGGFSIENIKGYPKDGKLGVFCVFVTDEDIVKIKNFINVYIKNVEKTSYSVLNVLTLPINIPIKMDFKMICSEFVDEILKLCNIDISEKPSPLVSPNDLYRSAKKNKKIYKLYEGTVEKYNQDKIINKLFRIQPVVASNVKEAAEFPIQFSKDGDLLIKHMNDLNYEKEYNNSHRLLSNYEKTSNIDGMKYELSKLWFLNSMLERDIYYSNDKDKSKVSSYTKCRARVLNDFNKYLKIVLKEDPSFNFEEYYKDSPFDNAVTKINASTLDYTVEYIKKLIRPI